MAADVNLRLRTGAAGCGAGSVTVGALACGGGTGGFFFLQPEARSVAASRGRAAFLLPLGVTVPFRGRPPRITNSSITLISSPEIEQRRRQSA